MSRLVRATQIAQTSLEWPAHERDGRIEQECHGDSVLLEIVKDIVASGANPFGDPQHLNETVSSGGLWVSPKGGAAAAPALAPRPQDLTGRRLGNYELIRRIGKGGMGSVYAARRVDQEFRKLVAVKVVKPGMETEEILLRFKHERQVLASLDHPNIARLLDGGTAEGLPYLVMEYVEGTQVDDYCTSHHLSIEDRLNLFCQICSAVQYAHQSLVVHRDLKPGNIIVSADGSPKLLDFGIAKVLNPEWSENAAMTQASQRPMTPDYASPEQVRGEPITTASDTYALGVLLYVLLTGRHPLSHLFSEVGFMKVVCDVEPEKPSVAVMRNEALPQPDRLRLKAQLEGDLDAITGMALRKESQRRYASVQHLADDIHRYLNGLPVRAQNDTLQYRASKFVRRHLGAVTAAAVVVVALLVSSVVSWMFYREAARERARAEARFSDVRQLARFVLFDFDRVITAGPTPARKAVIEKATEYLDRLAQDRTDDPTLAQEIVQGYLKVGDLQGNLYSANLGDRIAARATYERALRVVDQVKADPALAAEARARLADLLVQGGATRAALDAYAQARRIYTDRAAAGHFTSERELIAVLRKFAFANTQLGNYPQALELYEEMYRRAGAAIGRDSQGSGDLHRQMTLADLRAGEAMGRIGRVEDGLSRMKRALAAYEGASAAAPESGVARRSIATTSALIGDILVSNRRYAEAVSYFRNALRTAEALVHQDPRNEQFQRDVSNYLARLADAVARSGNVAEARALTVRALAVLRPLVSKGSPSEVDLRQYAWILLTTPVREFRDPQAARGYASMLVEGKSSDDPSVLDLLARAHAASGDFPQAVATEQKALALLPSDTQSDLRREIETNLAAFRSGIAYPADRR